MTDKQATVILLLLGIWAFVTGVASVTNFQFVWMGTIAGIAALVLGIVCLVLVLLKWLK